MKQLTFFLLLFSFQAVADTGVCYTPSPSITVLGDEYYALDHEIKLDKASASSLQALLHSLKGRWQGDLTETSCTGPDHTPKRKVSHLKTTADLSVNSKGELVIKARKSGYVDSIEKGETILLFANASMYDFEQKGNLIHASEKLRIRSKNGSSRLLETIINLNLQGEELRLKVEYFSNGVYVQTLNFTLTR